jgi:hypothetical protein
MARFLKPELVRLELTDGDWIMVKKRLTAGERSRMQMRMIKSMKAGQVPDIDFAQVGGLSQMIEYLIDWNITDADEKPLVIRDQPADVVASILHNMDPDAFDEIKLAIETHVAAVEQEKKLPTPPIAS